jgi:OOP family OmpA-OmpF porin
MRKLVAHVLCAILTVSIGSVAVGCASDPPPRPKTAKKPRVRKSPKPPPTSFEMVGDTLKLPGAIVFETGSDRINPVSDIVLELVADYLQAKQEVTLLRIEGHTDSDGNPGANQTLSEKRAMAVAHWLTDQGGVACNRLIPVGFGDTKPIASNSTADGKALNRRVAFVNAAVNGRAIGGMAATGHGHVAGDPCR